MADQSDQDSPFASLNYHDGGRGPSTGQIGSLAESLVRVTGVGGVSAVAAALMIDQGRGRDACELMQAILDDRAEEAERKRKAAQTRERLA